MFEIIEIWIPIDEFKKEYSNVELNYYIRIGDIIICYQIIFFDNINHDTTDGHLYFSFEEALEVSQKRI